MKPLELEVFLCRSDNFGVLVHDPETGLTATIDAPDAAAVEAAAKRRGWRISHIFTTHHHTDHVEGNLALKEQFGCEIIGPVNEAVAIPGLDKTMADGDSFTASRTVEPLPDPGDLGLGSHGIEQYEETARMVDGSSDPRAEALDRYWAELGEAAEVERTEYRAERIG